MLYRATIVLGSECFCRVQRKLKASLCTACRRQDPRTGLSPTLLPKTGYGWARVFTSQRAGKNSTGFLLKVVGMHTDKNAFKGACFLQWADFRDPCTDMPRSFSLACPGCKRKCSCKMNIWDGIHHPSLILITMPAAHMWIRSGAHWPWDFRTTSTPFPEGKAPSWSLLYTQNFLLRLFHKTLIPSIKSKVRKKREEITIKNTLKISQLHNSTICRLNSKFWPSKLNSILLKQFFPQFSFTFGHR